MRPATNVECPTGGIVVSDGNVGLPVCNGTQGLAGSAGPPGPSGPTGPAGPAGPAGGVPLSEETAVAPIANLAVEIGGGKPFRPIGTSRIGIDFPVEKLTTVGGLTRYRPGPPAIPPFTLLLGNDAPMADLQAKWNAALGGQLSQFDARLTLDTGKPGADIAHLVLRGCLIVGFSDGSLSPKSVTILPEDGFLETANFEWNNVLYESFDLRPVASPAFSIDSADAMALHRFSGGETTITITQEEAGQTKFPTIIQTKVVSELTLTALARAAGPNGEADGDLFDSLYLWAENQRLGGVLDGGPAVHIRLLDEKGFVVQTRTYNNSIATRFNFVNPLLVDPATNLAPYVFDMRIFAPTPPTIQ